MLDRNVSDFSVSLKCAFASLSQRAHYRRHALGFEYVTEIDGTKLFKKHKWRRKNNRLVRLTPHLTTAKGKGGGTGNNPNPNRLIACTTSFKASFYGIVRKGKRIRINRIRTLLLTLLLSSYDNSYMNGH